MDTDIYNKILNAQSDLNYHRLEIRNLLADEFPKGCVVCFMVRDGQKIPTVGTVVSHREDQVGVMMHTKAETVRSYRWRDLTKL